MIMLWVLVVLYSVIALPGACHHTDACIHTIIFTSRVTVEGKLSVCMICMKYNNNTGIYIALLK